MKLPGAPRLDYQFLLALELNLMRAFWWQAWPVAMGIGMALEDIPLEAFEAVYAEREEAEAKAALYQARKQMEMTEWRSKNMPEL